jgi:hypothetical protein
MAVGNMLTNGNIIDQNLPEAQKIFAELSKNNVPKAKESLDVVNKLIAEKGKTPAKLQQKIICLKNTSQECILPPYTNQNTHNHKTQKMY